jgi:uncharacterized phage protein (TIGR01671 family)
MREVNFRAWNKDYKVMEEVDMNYWYNFNNNLYILMQYTGLEDENGKEIYEGDILEETITDPQNGDELPYRKFLVFWAGSYASFALKDLLNEDNDQETMWDIVGLKIVGNIYENPELLERKIK